MSMQSQIRFFLGANSPRGFVSLFDQLEHGKDGWRMFVMKGGPGSGKSTLMKKVAARLAGEGHRMELIPCASDPDSLDAIIDYDGRLAMADGTAPHVIEAKFPGAYETILFTGSAWDESRLQRRRLQIMEISGAIGRLHGRATAALAGAGALLENNRSLAATAVDREAVARMGRALSAGWPVKEGCGKEALRLISAVSVGHIAFHAATLKALAPVVYEINDPWGAAAHALLSDLRLRAQEHGLGRIACPCSLVNPGKWEHLILPEAGVAFTTANRFHRGQWEAGEVIPLEADELMHTAKLARDLRDMQEQEALSGQLVLQAALSVERAKELHDDLEAEYVAAMDFEKLDALCQQVLDQVL